MDLESLKKYKHEPRMVKPRGLLNTPEISLKLYDMFTKDDCIGSNPTREAEEFLKEEIARGEINPHSGLGFAILSKDMLNVARWYKTYPIVLQNNLYEFKPNFQKVTETSTEEAGSFCIWELGIVNHEKEAWKKFLTSNKDNRDVTNYLNNVIEGDL
jgi:hypothetical protein